MVPGTQGAEFGVSLTNTVSSLSLKKKRRSRRRKE
jgi:hypothetical protein